MKSQIVKRSIVIRGHKTSVSLEDEFWRALKEIAHAESGTLTNIVSEIDRSRSHSNLSSTIRLFVLERMRRRLPDCSASNRDTREGKTTASGGERSQA